MRSSSDEEMSVDAKQFVHLPQIVGRNSPASPALQQGGGGGALQQPLHSAARTPSSQDIGRFGTGGSGGSKQHSPSFGQLNSPSFGQQRPSSAIRLASLNHTPTFKQASPQDDGDDSRFDEHALRHWFIVTFYCACFCGIGLL